MSNEQMIATGIIAAFAAVMALVNWWRITEAKDEIALLKLKIEYNRRTSDMRYKELKGSYMSESEYESIARIYGEKKE